MKNLLIILLLFAAVAMRGQDFSYDGAHSGFIEKSGKDYYFHGYKNGQTLPARIIVFTEMDSTGLADTLGLRWRNERSVSISGEINDSTKVYHRGLPFGTIRAKYIRGSVVYGNWYMDTEHTAPQQDTIFEIFYNNDFRDQFSEIVNGRLTNRVGASLGKSDAEIFKYLKKNTISYNQKKGMYLKVQAKRWYGSSPVHGHDAGFDYIMEVTKVLEADTTRTLWGYYANEIEHGRAVNLYGTKVVNFPNDFATGKIYNYNGKANGYKIRLVIERKSGNILRYLLTYKKDKKKWQTIKGTLLLDFPSYAQAVRPEPYEYEYTYESEAWLKVPFSIGIPVDVPDSIQFIYLKDIMAGYDDPGISCKLKRVN